MSASSNAAKTRCPKGHPYSIANTYIDVLRSSRVCRACRAAIARASYAKRATTKRGMATIRRTARRKFHRARDTLTRAYVAARLRIPVALAPDTLIALHRTEIQIKRAVKAYMKKFNQPFP